MKKLLSLFLSLSLLLGFTTTVYASDEIVQESIEFLEDGSYFTTTVIMNNASAPIALFANTRSGSKTTTYNSSSGDKLWSVTVTGSFTYTGSSATCTKATVSTSTSSSSWKVGNSSSSKSGNKANAIATGINYILSTPIASVTKTVTLTCSADGNLF